jgi:DNA-binding NtrC family response regulator
MTVLDHEHRGADRVEGFGYRSFEPSAPLLVIDDMVVHRLLLCRLAAKAGLRPFEAQDCDDVERLTARRSFACATLDLDLGESVGIEVLRHFSRCGFRAPIIVLSGANLEAARDLRTLGQNLRLAMLEPMQKPVDLYGLRQCFAAAATLWQENPAPGLF